MSPDPVVERPVGADVAKYGGIAIGVLSVVGLIVGLILVQSLSGYARATVSVSQSALGAISQTIAAVDDVALDTSASMAAASRSVEEASSTLDEAMGSLEGLGSLLEEEIPETIESMRRSMPAAIQAAESVDATLRTLSLFGVDYSPDEPFGESLGRIDRALAPLPGELRTQSESIQELIESGDSMVGEIDSLSTTMDDLEESLTGFTSLATTYGSTVAEAEARIEEADGSIGGRLWMLRTMLVIAAIVGMGVGVVLFLLGDQVQSLHDRVAAWNEAGQLDREETTART
jgi:prefoldin subunit 5